VLTFCGCVIGMGVAIFLTWVIPPMPLYGDLYKTTNHEGDIFLHASATVMMVSFAILSLVGIVSGVLPGAEGRAHGSGGSRCTTSSRVAGVHQQLRDLTHWPSSRHQAQGRCYLGSRALVPS